MTGSIQGTAYLLHHFQGKLAPLPGFLDLLVGKLLRRNFHQVVIGHMPALHQFIQRLFSVVASGCCGFLVHTPTFVPYFRGRLRLPAGLEQAVLWHNNEADRAIYSTLFQQSGIMTPEEILNCREPEKELDATSYAAYQTSCGALVLCLMPP